MMQEPTLLRCMTNVMQLYDIYHTIARHMSCDCVANVTQSTHLGFYTMKMRFYE